ncbi:uncharacterized protein SCHCODRAFT_02526144 [Schizophyllum commune H4-8]|uniref:uncharacterized protein n=1 Tax=Schizophyllum commune (strain H4-8 / FGSC 9210) TaxID=578458 RepID=UPI00215F771D|nr:uncharacterized protein SCHCODRAFT_02526144 [Schizophyllum commune H4-8]KAI5900309.1 hypothetical protein SCHCODRAFT_02526144 [Schizophyllum commune H4-8]
MYPTMDQSDALCRAQAVANNPLHRSAYVPNDSEAVVIKKAADELRGIDVQIAEQINSLIQQQATVRGQISVHDALLSPCRRLHPEIISLIFLLAVPDDWEEAYVGRRSLNFARVCHPWREIALTTSRLWSKLRFDALTNWQTFREEPSLLAAELERTAQVSLDIDLQMRYGYATLWPDHPTADELWEIDDAWRILCAQSHRWERATLDCLPVHIYESMGRRLFPALNNLSFRVDERSNTAIQLPLHSFRHAPNVTCLWIDYKSPVPTFEIPRMWSIVDLTIICVDSITVSPEPSLDAFMACSATLRSCHFAADEKFNERAIPSRPTLFPALKDIHFNNNAVFLCYLISAPNVEKLHLSGYSSYNQFEALQSMLDRSRECKHLRIFALSQLDPPAAEPIIECLRRLPLLTDVTLTEDALQENIEFPLITVDLISALDRSSGGTGAKFLLPNLSRLEMDFGGRECSAEQEDSLRDAIYASILSRDGPLEVDGVTLQPLQSCTIHGDECLPPNPFSVLEAFHRKRSNDFAYADLDWIV